MESSDLKKVGLKVTVPRKKILEIFEKSAAKHLSAEDIYRIAFAENEDISLGTVYRVLTQFESAGLVVKHSFNGNAAVFELVQADYHRHEHMVCRKCGHIFEFQDSLIESQMRKIAHEYNLKLSDHTLTMYAECHNKACRYLNTSK